MSTLTESAQALWDLLDRDGYNPQVVLILADCLEEEGGSEPLWDGLRDMVKQGYQPYYTIRDNGWWWLKPLQFERPLIYKRCEIALEIFNHIDGKYHASLARFDTLSSAIKAYVRAWVALNCS